MTAPSLRAGAGRAEVDLPDSIFPIDGFAAVHDPLHVRVLIAEDAVGRVVLASVELTSLPDEFVDALRASVADAAETEPGRVVIAATHTFSAPHIAARPDTGGTTPATDHVRLAVGAAVLEALARALTDLRPARIGAGTGTARVAVNRDVETADGWWLGANDAAPSDAAVGVIRFEGLDGAPIAAVLSAGVQSSVMHDARESDGRLLVTADLAGAAARHVERAYDDRLVALFLVGAAGDQAPYLTAAQTSLDRHGAPVRTDAVGGGHLLVQLLGERLGAETIRVLEDVVDCAEGTVDVVSGAAVVPGQIAPQSFRDLRPSRSYRFTPTGEHTVPFWVARLGALAIVGLRPELTNLTGARIKRESPFAFTIVATMVNGSAKYLPDATAYERRTYEAMSARYAAGSAETVADAIGSLLRKAAHDS